MRFINGAAQPGSTVFFYLKQMEFILEADYNLIDRVY